MAVQENHVNKYQHRQGLVEHLHRVGILVRCETMLGYSVVVPM